MNLVFVDTAYWLAITNPRDQHHRVATEASMSLQNCSLVTTDAVLSEFLTAIADPGPRLRDRAPKIVRELLTGVNSVEVVPQTRKLFLKGLTFYEERSDKGYSLPDCISMTVKAERSITEVLTSDGHFEQEGFSILMPTT